MQPPYAALTKFRSTAVFNPWADVDTLDPRAPRGAPRAAPAARLARLKAHFDIEPVLLLVGEAAGYQGCRCSGIPFTHERLLMEQRVPRVVANGRLSRRARPWCEPSATVVWGALHALGLAERVVLWNAFAWHPYRPGEPHSNRRPTAAELDAGRPVLAGVLAAFAGVPVVAVGRVAEAALARLGCGPSAVLRHPSMGGAKLFREGLAAIAAKLSRHAPPRRPAAGLRGRRRR